MTLEPGLGDVDLAKRATVGVVELLAVVQAGALKRRADRVKHADLDAESMVSNMTK